MFTHPQQGFDPEEVLRLRKEAGKWLKELREGAGLSQRDLAAALGIDYYTFVSQIESGRGRVPPAQMRVWATVLKVDPRTFATTLMKFYDPLSYDLIFGGDKDAADPASSTLEARVEKLERLVIGSTR